MEQYTLQPNGASAPMEAPDAPVSTSPDVPAERRRMSRIGFALFLLLVVTSALQTGAGIVVPQLFPAWLQEPWYFWALALIPMYLIGAPLCILLLCRVPGEQWDGERLRFSKWLFFLVLSICLLYLGNLAGTGVNALIELLRGSPVANALETIVTGSNPLYTILFAVILGPLVEEWIFRKLLIDRLHRYGDRAAILMSALLFGLLHGNFAQFFYAFALGVLFGYIYARTRRLRYTVLLHMTINFLGSVVSVWLADGMDTAALSSGDASAVLALAASPKMLLLSLYGWLMIGCTIAGVVLLIVNRKKAVLRTGVCPLPKGVRGRVLFGNAGVILYIIFCAALFILSAVM